MCRAEDGADGVEAGPLAVMNAEPHSRGGNDDDDDLWDEAPKPPKEAAPKAKAAANKPKQVSILHYKVCCIEP